MLSLVDVGPLNHILNPEDYERDKEDAQKTFVRGLANPFLVFGKEAYPDSIDDRKDRADYFAERANQGQFAGMGIEEGQGFPPFSSRAGTNGDLQWYDQLLSGLPSRSN